MNADFIRERITRLRLQKDVSEYKMSYDLGHSRGYINNISSGQALPSMAEFLAICEYFGITPAEFFSPERSNPLLLNDVQKLTQQLDENDLELIVGLLRRLAKDNQKTAE